MSKKTELRSLIDHIVDEVSCHSTIEGICSGCSDNRDPHIIVTDDFRYGKDKKTDFERLADGILNVLQRHGIDMTTLWTKSLYMGDEKLYKGSAQISNSVRLNEGKDGVSKMRPKITEKGITIRLKAVGLCRRISPRSCATCKWCMQSGSEKGLAGLTIKLFRCIRPNGMGMKGDERFYFICDGYTRSAD